MLDQNTDTTLHILHRILTDNPGIKGHIKSASVGEEVREALPVSSFADKDNRLFPIHTRAHAVLSKAYTIKQADIAPHIISNIDNALAIHGVDSSVFKTTVTKVASQQQSKNFILPSKRALNIKKASDIKVAEERLLQIKSKLTPEELSEGAMRLFKAAAFFNEDISSDTAQLAGLTRCDLEKAAEWVDARVNVAKTDKQKDLYSKVATALRTSQDATRDDLVKVAGLLDKLDSMNDLKRFYNKYIPTPLMTIFNTKTAMENCVYINGKELPIDRLQAMDPKTIGDIVGDDIIPEITDGGGNIDVDKFSEIVDTLPKDMKDLLVKKLGL